MKRNGQTQENVPFSLDIIPDNTPDSAIEIISSLYGMVAYVLFFLINQIILYLDICKQTNYLDLTALVVTLKHLFNLLVVQDLATATFFSQCEISLVVTVAILHVFSNVHTLQNTIPR